MRMIIAKNLGATLAGRTVGRNEHCRINFKMPPWISMDITRRQSLADHAALPQQQSARLFGVGCRRFCQQCGFRATCHNHFHRHLA